MATCLLLFSLVNRAFQISRRFHSISGPLCEVVKKGCINNYFSFWLCNDREWEQTKGGNKLKPATSSFVTCGSRSLDVGQTNIPHRLTNKAGNCRLDSECSCFLQSLIAAAERDGFWREGKLIRGGWKAKMEASNESTKENESGGEQEAETGSKREN